MFIKVCVRDLYIIFCVCETQSVMRCVRFYFVNPLKDLCVRMEICATLLVLHVCVIFVHAQYIFSVSKNYHVTKPEQMEMSKSYAQISNYTQCPIFQTSLLMCAYNSQMWTQLLSQTNYRKCNTHYSFFSHIR